MEMMRGPQFCQLPLPVRQLFGRHFHARAIVG
jgi:hypothetical protein